MTRKYFGTDGIRGRTNTAKLTPEVALKAGMAAGRIFTHGDHRHRVVIGKDTRLSGYMIESALVSGFTAVGMDVFQFGPLPTPAIAMLTRSLRADLGVMVSASHNPYEDNGIKLFGPDGFKLSDETESEIEALMASDMSQRLAAPPSLGRATRLEDAAGTLGANRLWVFLFVTLPLILPGIIAGMILCFAKAMGEFGATITFVSNIPGETQTLPSAIYTFTQIPGGETGALRLTLVSIVISMGALVVSEVMARRIGHGLSFE